MSQITNHKVISSSALVHDSIPSSHTVGTTKLLKILTRFTPNFRWTSDILHTNIRIPRVNYSIGVYVISYVGQPNGSGTEHHWKIATDDPDAQVVLNNLVKNSSSSLATLPKKSNPSQSNSTTYDKNGITFRSPAEVNIADELETRGILFFANARCRIKNRHSVVYTKEVDFLVFCNGSARILEVDGQEYHQSPEADYERDRLFDKYGLRTSRFSAKHCMDNPEDVVDEFLELF